jgi:hypothetical protein
MMRRRYERWTNYARLWRNRAKRENWQSDFKGKILFQDGVSCPETGETSCRWRKLRELGDSGSF